MSLRALVPALSLALPLVSAGCCVNPFIGTDTNARPGDPGTPERETGGSLEEHQPALQAGDELGDTRSGFDMRLVRVQPGIHIDTEQVCDVDAAGRLESIEITDDSESRYDAGATQRMSIRCLAPTGESWADLVFTATDASFAPEVRPGARIRVRIRAADGGFFDYPVVDFVAAEGESRARPSDDSALAAGPLPNGFDLRQIQRDPALVGTRQECVVAHAGDIDLLTPADLRRRSYPDGVQNRMTVRCRHASGEEFADLVFMPAQALASLHIGRGDVVPVTIVARSGGFSDYPVLQLSSE